MATFLSVASSPPSLPLYPMWGFKAEELDMSWTHSWLGREEPQTLMQPESDKQARLLWEPQPSLETPCAQIRFFIRICEWKIPGTGKAGKWHSNLWLGRQLQRAHEANWVSRTVRKQKQRGGPKMYVRRNRSRSHYWWGGSHTRAVMGDQRIQSLKLPCSPQFLNYFLWFQEGLSLWPLLSFVSLQ